MKRKTKIIIGTVLMLVFASSMLATSAVEIDENQGDQMSFPFWKHYIVDGINYGNEDIREDITFTFWKLYHVETGLPSDWK
jgi:hypothetical protein